MYHEVIIAGHVGTVPETRILSSGTSVTHFNMASNRTYKVGEEQKTETIWFRVSAFSKLGDTVSQYVTKGMSVLVVGQFTPNELGEPRIYTDKAGNTRSAYEIRAKEVKFLSSKKEQAETTTTEDPPF